MLTLPKRPMRTIQINRGGETIDMDWDQNVPPTKTDVMAWINRREASPAQAPSTGRISANINKGLAPGAAQEIDPSVPTMEKQHVTNPFEVLGATGSATGRAVGSLLDKPGNTKDAFYEGLKGARGAVTGEGVTTPSQEIEKRTGVKNPAWADLVTDSVADIGNVADPANMITHGAPLMAGGLTLRGSGKAAMKGGKAALEAANQLRIASMLSGWALPKSVIGNVGSPLVATAEHLAEGKGLKSFAPIKEALNVKANVKELGAGWKRGANPQMPGAAGIGKYNPITRAMGASDYATEKGLMRSGLAEKDAQRLLLRDPQWGLRGESNPILDYLVPFRKTAFNILQGGAKTVQDHPFLSIGAGAAGAGVGATTNDPKTLGLSAALMGPYALPYVIGAGATAGARAAGGLSPIPDWSLQQAVDDPLHPFTAPAFTNMFNEPKDKSGSGTRLTRGSSSLTRRSSR